MTEIPDDIMEAAVMLWYEDLGFVNDRNGFVARLAVAMSAIRLAERQRCADIIKNRSWPVVTYEETTEDMLENAVAAILSPAVEG